MWKNSSDLSSNARKSQEPSIGYSNQRAVAFDFHVHSPAVNLRRLVLEYRLKIYSNKVAFSAVTALGVLLATCRVHPTRDSHYVAGLTADAMFVVHALQEFAFDKPVQFREFVMWQPRSIFDHEMYAAITNALPHATGYRGEDFHVFPSGLDPWGVPFWIRVTFVATTKDQSAREVQTFEIKVWSSGPNKRNEQGSGDDILCGPFEAKAW